MEDLLSLSRWSDDVSAVRTAILRDVVYASADSNRFANIFFSLRWAVLLGVLPLPLARWRDTAVAVSTHWQEASAALESGDARGKQPTVAAPRRTRFDESSSSSDGDGEPARRGTSTAAANPLRPAAGTRYAHEFRVNTQRREVRKDLDRLFWDVPVFTEDSVQSKGDVETLILTYCLLHERDYRQGLHEIAAFLYCACMTDYEWASQAELALGEAASSSGPIRAALDAVRAVLPTRSCALALAYTLFERLLGSDGMRLESWFYVSSEAEDTQGIVAASAHVQDNLLRAIDPPLAHELSTVYEIQSATYLIRWLRLLFLREFTLPQSMLVWTVVFADFHTRCESAGGASHYTLENSLVVFVAVAMLEHIADVLSLSAETALRALMKYPPQTEVLTVLRGAAALACLPALSQALAPPTPRPTPPQPRPHALYAPSSSRAAEMLPMVERQGHELSAVIQSLEAYWFPAEDDPPAQREAREIAYAEAIARLKKVRDVLLYGVDE